MFRSSVRTAPSMASRAFRASWTRSSDCSRRRSTASTAVAAAACEDSISSRCASRFPAEVGRRSSREDPTTDQHERQVALARRVIEQSLRQGDDLVHRDSDGEERDPGEHLSSPIGQRRSQRDGGHHQPCRERHQRAGQVHRVPSAHRLDTDVGDEGHHRSRCRHDERRIRQPPRIRACCPSSPHGEEHERDHGRQQRGAGRLLEVTMTIDRRGHVPKAEPHRSQEQCCREEWQAGIGADAPAQDTERRRDGNRRDRTDGEQVPEIPKWLAVVEQLVERDQQRDEQTHGQANDERRRPRPLGKRARRRARHHCPHAQHDPRSLPVPGYAPRYGRSPYTPRNRV